MQRGCELSLRSYVMPAQHSILLSAILNNLAFLVLPAAFRRQLVAVDYNLCLSTLSGNKVQGQPVGLARCKRTKSKQWKVTPRMHWQNGFCRCLTYDRRVDELVQQRCDYRYSLLHTFLLCQLHIAYPRGQSTQGKSFTI
jgi:hypothetical protein